MKKKAIFFARVHDINVLKRNEFYAVDIQILEELGWEVQIATNPLRIPNGDLYFVWWWTWAFAPLIKAKLVGKPVIIVGTFDHIMPDGSLEKFNKRLKIHQTAIKLTLKYSDANIFVTNTEFKKITSIFAVSNPGFAYHAIDLNAYRKVSKTREPFMLTICWLTKQNAERKCIRQSIEATKILLETHPEYKLIICGEKRDAYPELVRFTDEIGCRQKVEFRGVVTKEEKIALLQTCSVYLQPTVVEGFGVAIVEAMACGAPVVTTERGVIPEVVSNCAVYVKHNSPIEIAQAAKQLIADVKLRDDIITRARVRVETYFGYESRREKMRKIISEVVFEKGLEA
jgi:glycosyltransferase involved in cell wall biosynthesis